MELVFILEYLLHYFVVLIVVGYIDIDNVRVQALYEESAWICALTTSLS